MSRVMTLGDVANEIVLPSVSIAGQAFGPSIAASIFGTAAWAVPVVGAAIGGATLALAKILNRKGPKQKEITTQMVNEVEQVLKQNLDAYRASARTQADQAAAIANFDAAWTWLTSADGCGNPQLGDPGQRCIAERQRGGSAPWCPTGTGCDWFALYRDPIASDLDVKPNPSAIEQLFGTSADSSGANAGNGAGGPAAGPLLALGLIALGVMLS